MDGKSGRLELVQSDLEKGRDWSQDVQEEGKKKV